MSTVALESFLLPLKDFLDDDKVEEIIVNRPGEVFVEKGGEWTRHEMPDISKSRLQSIAATAAHFSDQRVSEKMPLMSASLPSGNRVQFVMPPACPSYMFGLAIRKPSPLDYSLDDYASMGTFGMKALSCARHGTTADIAYRAAIERWRSARRDGRPTDQLLIDCIRQAVRGGKLIFVSGGTATGKTTLLRAIIKELDRRLRLVTLQDVHELRNLPHDNRFHLLAVKGDGQGKANVTMTALLEAALRLRPDCIILGELRGAEAYPFLRAAISGHPGVSCAHADGVDHLFDQVALMVMQSGLGLTMAQILEFLRSIIDVVIQLNRFEGGFRAVSDVYFRDAPAAVAASPLHAVA